MVKTKKFTRNPEEKKERIYKAFFDLVIKNGYDKTSTNHIAEAANIGIGTVYRHFPNGKSDIILKYFENSKDIVFNIKDFEKLKEVNFVNTFERFIRSNLENQKKNPGYRIAFRQSIMSDKELKEKYKTKIAEINTEIVKELRSASEFLRSAPEDQLIKAFNFIHNFLEANIHYHLFVMKMFDDDEKFIKFLSNLMGFIRNAGFLRK